MSLWFDKKGNIIMDLKHEDLLKKIQEYADKLAKENHYKYFKLTGYEFSWAQGYNDGRELPF